jgi:outer membrane protein OmpA-like peptidoglycan-associated protein
MYQSFDHSAGSGTRITDKVGEYNSPLNNVSNTVASSYGGSLGVRMLFGKLREKDKDKDGVPDKRDKCPDVFGLAKFNGCPDKDIDGVADDQDQCPDVFGLAQFHGCPDSDGDGVPDDKDACVYQPGPARFNGCPDTDGDGVPDSEDKCPTVMGPISNGGCPLPPPVETTPGRPTREPYIGMLGHDLGEPILFDLGKTKIKDISIPILMEAVMELNNNENAFIAIDGHTDAVGSDRLNDPLSFRRASAVRKYLIDMGANPSRMVAVGHGSRQPVAPNTTPEGRAMNRRVMMSLKHRPKQ